MALPVLTWNIINETIITVTVPTYADFLNKVESVIAGSTHWRVNAKNLDAVNSRGWIELAPKSNVAGVTEGRILLMYSTGSVSGSVGNERPLIATRQPPWDTASSGFYIKMWIGISNNAASAENVGPAADPWTNASPYGGSNWSRLFPLHSGYPSGSSFIGVIDSAESITIYWTSGNVNQIQYFTAGKLLESVDGESASWLAFIGLTYGDFNTPAPGGPWISAPTTDNLPPIAQSTSQNSTGVNQRSVGFAIINGVLYGVGQSSFARVSSSSILSGMSNNTSAIFQAIPLSGGPYNTGASDSLLGFFRQVRWGPAAYRGQKLSSSGVEQGICLNYASASAGQKPWGLWFDHFR